MPSLDTYRASSDRYDELLEDKRLPREHWRALVERIDAMGGEWVDRGVVLARRLIVEDGVSYNVYADPQGRDRPWALDPMPFLMSAEEWATIERGVAQRARLLDALLADLYGPQTLLREGVVPAEIVFGHPNFLWPCCDSLPANARRLHLYAADLARGPDGKWWVLGDRTQTPSGLGYALENRRIVARAFPELHEATPVQPLEQFFLELRESMQGMVAGDESPLAVVLTPGPFNETYFEHAYLARHLNLVLVEGHDLTVRGETLYLKTLAGLKRVHAILRRLDDDFCDPAELRADSALGIPGLLQVVRAGRVMVANALGSGVLESAAWLGFLPPAAERLLGETLELPSVATWWCGERPAFEQVLAKLDQLVIKSVYPNQKFEPVFGRDLAPIERAKLIERLRARPYAYVAQERIALSQTPSWGGRGFVGRPLMIRVYAAATDSGYAVMPGGLARVGADALVNVVSSQRGGGSKDVWVLAASAARGDVPDSTHLLRPRARNEDLPSRLAENLFWLGRYCERCEGKARLLRATLGGDGRTSTFASALTICRQFGLVTADAGAAAACFDTACPIGLSADLKRLDWVATQARGRLSSEHWRALGVVQRQFQQAQLQRDDAREALDQLILGLSALTGFALDDMVQDDGWQLMMLGRRLERMHFLANLIGNTLTAAAGSTRAALDWLLDIANSTIAYRTRYTDQPLLAPTLGLVVCDAANARSLVFQWQDVRAKIHNLGATSLLAEESPFVRLVQGVIGMDFGCLEGNGRAAVTARRDFAQDLARLAEQTLALSDQLSMRYFSHTGSDWHMVAA
jgi:uncharacterized circularly permuted ATP-grasp superfamily protein/uncharacterized alpha-E superfamily protein